MLLVYFIGFSTMFSDSAQEIPCRRTMDLIEAQLSFYKGGFTFKRSTKVDMPSKK